jgi:hypothetical protein
MARRVDHPARSGGRRYGDGLGRIGRCPVEHCRGEGGCHAVCSPVVPVISRPRGRHSRRRTVRRRDSMRPGWPRPGRRSGRRSARSVRRVGAATRQGDVAAARSWLLVREFRPPTRFSRAAADGTLALVQLETGAITPAAAAAVVRRISSIPTTGGSARLSRTVDERSSSASARLAPTRQRRCSDTGRSSASLPTAARHHCVARNDDRAPTARCAVRVGRSVSDSLERVNGRLEGSGPRRCLAARRYAARASWTDFCAWSRSNTDAG